MAVRRVPSLVLSLSLLWGVSVGCGTAPNVTSVLDTGSSVAVRFSPRGGCTEAIVSEIRQARHTILVQAYSFTSAPIAQALIEAKRRGVNVELVVDKSQVNAKGEQVRVCQESGILTRIDSQHSIAHNKVMVIDGETVITGSFNFSRAAEEQNAENLVILKGHPDLVGAYQENFRLHRDHSNLLEK